MEPHQRQHPLYVCRLDSRHAHQTEKALLSRIERPLQVAGGVLEPELVAALLVHDLHAAWRLR